MTFPSDPEQRTPDNDGQTDPSEDRLDPVGDPVPSTGADREHAADGPGALPDAESAPITPPEPDSEPMETGSAELGTQALREQDQAEWGPERSAEADSSEPESVILVDRAEDSAHEAAGSRIEVTEPSVATSAQPSGNKSGRELRRLARILGVTSVLALGLLWVLSRLIDRQSNADLLDLIPESRAALTSLLEARSAEALSSLVLDNGWRVAIPEIDGASPEGLGFSEILPGISLPVLVFREEGGATLLISLVNYAFLDTHEGLLYLSREVLEAVGAEDTFVLPRSTPQVLVWRKGDELYLAATEGDREELAGRIRP